MEEIPKRANDAMTLSMICGYDGNIHSYGQLIAHVSRMAGVLSRISKFLLINYDGYLLALFLLFFTLLNSVLHTHVRVCTCVCMY